MANDLDRLFREGLDPMEVTPNSESWQEVQNQLKKNNAGGWLWPSAIAAAITLLLVAIFILRSSQPIKEGTFASIDHPKVPASEVLDIQVPERQNIESKKVIPIKKMKEDDHMQPLQYDNYSLAGIQQTQLEIVHIPSLHLVGQEKDMESHNVKITYIASNKGNEIKDGKINQFITSISQEPAGLLADLRDAKDNLFSRN